VDVRKTVHTRSLNPGGISNNKKIKVQKFKNSNCWYKKPETGNKKK
jgi:hypothetical protein